MRIIKLIVILISCVITQNALSQPSWTFDPFGREKKPQKFENRKLGSEKTTEKKFTKPRQFLQNSVTHYNYYFNASNKLNTVIDRAKNSQQDNFTKLLSFYPYSLDNTVAQKSELDSVIYKATAGILLHDLRNDWIDNLYLLIGKSYYLKKDFDSAIMAFQFINYNLFSRKKKQEDDDKIIGTNTESVNNIISIANKENRNFFQKIASLPPSRNDALIWMIRTFTEQEAYGEAAGLINILNNDPNLPGRLENDLNEVSAYWFYKQNMYDSSAIYLEKALSNADSKNDKARWEFLLAQMLEMNKQYEKASEYYAKAAHHTVNPLMDIYAQLNDAKMYKESEGLKGLNNTIEKLTRMARKDKFDGYRDIIYYSIAQLYMQKPDTAAAVVNYFKSIKVNENNGAYRNKCFLRLADIAYAKKDYRNAYAYYDSLQTDDINLADQIANIQLRKATLQKIVEKIANIEKQDSLQQIAAMPGAEREAFIKNILKKLSKNQSAKEESNNGVTAITFNNNTNNQPTDLFTDDASDGWYFYNTAMKNKGLNEFKAKWGDRANLDNWRRKSALDKAVNINTYNANNNNEADTTETSENKTEVTELSFEGLMKNIPLTPAAMDSSNKIIANNMFQLGKLYQNELEDYEQAITTYEEHLQRFPSWLRDGEIYLNLFYCYYKLGNLAKANYYKNLLNTQFAKSKFALMANDPSAFNPKNQNTSATKKYEDIYNLFIEGSFAEALSQKRQADSVYGNIYWTPQLLYIESVYYIRQRSDSIAIQTLQKLIELYPASPMVAKAQNMIDVLKRRNEIESYLANLNITRENDDILPTPNDDNGKAVVNKDPEMQKPVVVKPIENDKKPVTINNPTIDTVKKVVANPVKPRMDTVKTAPAKVDTVKQAEAPKVDTPKIVTPPVDTVTKTIPVKVDTVKRAEPSKIDTPKRVLPAVDSVKKVAPALSNGVFTMALESPHSVVMLLDKVDQVYITEAKNAIARYNRENYGTQSIEITKDVLDINRTMLVFSRFVNAEAALEYYIKLKKAAPVEIGWLPTNKYSLLIITNENLQLLKNNKDVNSYRDLLNKQFPNKF